MGKCYQVCMTIGLLIVLLLSGLQIDNAFYTLPSSIELPEQFVVAENRIYETESGYVHLEKKDYWSVGNTARLTSAFFKRTQNRQNEVIFSIWNTSFKVILFSIVMILIAAGGAGLSMPFRCLLYYIHNKDGKKRIA